MSPRKNKHISDEQWAFCQARFIWLCAKGLTRNEISQQTGIKRETLKEWREFQPFRDIIARYSSDNGKYFEDRAAAYAEHLSRERALKTAENRRRIEAGKLRNRARIEAQRKSGRAGVYFFQAVGGGDYVKIGYTSNIRGRLHQLRCGCPLPTRVLLFAKATIDDEAELHRRFHYLRVHGEWFKPDLMLMALIDSWQDRAYKLGALKNVRRIAPRHVQEAHGA